MTRKEIAGLALEEGDVVEVQVPGAYSWGPCLLRVGAVTEDAVQVMVLDTLNEDEAIDGVSLFGYERRKGPEDRSSAHGWNLWFEGIEGLRVVERA